ncbi:response regulator, partial [Myxococcota bacterium]|nr:response regulator [Myxococcota bacterium]
EPAPAAAPAQRPRRRGTVLVVEDEPQVRRLVVRALERAGWNVLQASTGLEGLAVAEAHAGPLELLVTDVVMPKMNGRALAERLLATRPGLATLFVSGYSEEMVQHGLPPGRAAFLPKPFTAPVLLSKLEELLDGEHGAAAR